MTSPPDDRSLGGAPQPDEPSDPVEASTPPPSPPPARDDETAAGPDADSASTPSVPGGPATDLPADATDPPTGDRPTVEPTELTEPAEPTGAPTADPAEQSGADPAQTEQDADAASPGDEAVGTAPDLETAGTAHDHSEGDRTTVLPASTTPAAAGPTAAAAIGSSVVVPSSGPADAPDDDPGGDPDGVRADEPAPARRRAPGLLPVIGAAAAVVLLGLIGWLAWELRQQSLADTSRAESLDTARDAARLLFSYDHESLEDDFAAGLEVTTGDFREEYERTTREVVLPVAEEYDAVVEAEVVDAAIVSAEPDRAVALVFLNQTTTSTRVDGPKIDQSRVRMSLRKVDGEWLVDEVTAL